MDAQHSGGPDARKLAVIWLGGSLVVWSVSVLCAGLLVWSGQLRQAKDAFVADAQTVHRHAEAALRANEHALAALAAFAEADDGSDGDPTVLQRYARRLLADFPQILHVALLLPAQSGAAWRQSSDPRGLLYLLDRPAQLLPLGAVPTLREATELARRQPGLTASRLLKAPSGEAVILLVRPLQDSDAVATARPALVLPVAVNRVLPAPDALPPRLSVALERAGADAGQPAQLRPGFPLLRGANTVTAGGRGFALISHRQLGWDMIRPHVAAVFLAAAALSLLLAVRYGRSRIQREHSRRTAEFKLYRLANYDSLTGLPNRNLFKDRLQRALSRARHDGSGVALCFIDLDGFKAVNDSAGHDTGDRLLRLVAQRLSAAVRTQDTVARLSGDEFVVVLEGVRGKNDAERVMGQLRDSFIESFVVGEFQFILTASIGLAVFPDDGDEPAQLLRRADARMYAVKYPEWIAAAAPAWMPASPPPSISTRHCEEPQRRSKLETAGCLLRIK